jgi:hypothetical protein
MLLEISPKNSSLNALSSKLVGGKAFGLIRLSNHGHKIPKSYVVTTNYFNQLIKLPELENSYHEFLNACISIDRDVIAENIKRWQSKLLSTAKKNSQLLIPMIKLSIESLLRLGTVTIRSSVSIEDGSEHSFAGIFESYLDLKNIDAIESAIYKCISIAFSEKAVFYALENGIDLKLIQPAVLMQEHIKASTSGVYFTCDPTPQGSYQQGLISMTKGCGDELMSGENQGISFKVGLPMTQFPPLAQPYSKSLLELIKTGEELQKNLKAPLDIEWCIKDDNFYFLQLRKITTLNSWQSQNITWTRKISEERYPEALSPLGWSMLLGVFDVNLQTLKKRFGLVATSSNQVAKLINNYVYANDSFFSFPENVNANVLHQLKYLPKLFISLVSSLLLLPALIHCSKIFKNWISFKTLIIMKLFSAYIFSHTKDIITKWDESLNLLINEFDTAHTNTINLADKNKTYEYRNSLEKIAFKYMEPDLAIYIIKMACVWMLNTISKSLFPNEQTEYLLLNFTKGLKSNQTLEMNQQLEELSVFN